MEVEEGNGFVDWLVVGSMDMVPIIIILTEWCGTNRM